MAVAIPFIMLAVQGVGMAMQARNERRAARLTEQSGTSQRRASESVATLNEYNASVARIQARDALNRGAEEEARFRQSVEVLIGAQRGAFAASNIDVGYGSPVDVVADAAELGEIDALTIRMNAAREAWGFEVTADDYRQRADIARREGVMLESEAAGRASLIRQTSNTTLAVGAMSLIPSGASAVDGYRQRRPAATAPRATGYRMPAGTFAPGAAPTSRPYSGAFSGLRFN